MSIDHKELAISVAMAFYHNRAPLTVTLDLAHWTNEDGVGFLARLLAESADYKFRVKGIRTDTQGFAKLGAEMDRANSGLAQGVPIVLDPSIDFDAAEIVIEPN